MAGKHAIVIATGSDVARLPGIDIDERRIVSSTGALVLDIGSTTTDLVLIAIGRIRARGRDDHGRKRFKGQLLGAEGNLARVQREDAPAGEPADVMLPIAPFTETPIRSSRS